MKTLKTIAIILACGATVLGLAACAQKPQELSHIQAFSASKESKIDPIRYAALRDTALSVGAQGGLAWRSQKIDAMLKTEAPKLNQIFDFRQLILNHNVLPPVLEESQNSMNLASLRSIRLASQTYKIVSQPRFITAPPSWRDYLWMDYAKPAKPNQTLLPKDAAERVVWNQYIQQGWKQGIHQADEIFSSNLGRLTRDFDGMILYRKLLAQNMVTAPYVAETHLGVTGNGNNLRIDDRILRITSISQLKSNSNVWMPVIRKGESYQNE